MLAVDAYLKENGIRTYEGGKGHIKAEVEHQCVDVFVGQESGPYVSWFPGPVDSILIDEVFPYGVGHLEGFPCALPNNLEQYLTKIYGPTWRTPDTGFRHNWDAPRKDLKDSR